MKSYKTVISLFFMVLLSSGCTRDAFKSHLRCNRDAPKDNLTDGSIVDQSYAYAGDEKATELNLDKDSSASEDLTLSPEFSDISSQLSKRTIYFEYDNSQILNKFVVLIEAHAQYLINHPNQKITLEGHADERGTREYNIALAEQRAKSVSSRMQLMGVMRHQLEIVSYGEEKPAVLEHNRAAYALNRRVEIIYQ